jgi:hypothetical protein
VQPTSTATSAIPLKCGSDLEFSSSGLSAAVEPAIPSDDAGRALADFLAAPPPGYSWPTQGWRRLVDSGDQTLFAAQSPSAEEGSLAFVELRPIDGALGVGSYGECWPERVLGPDVGGGAWTLADPVSTGDAWLEVLVSERACASGQAPGGRVRPPTLAESSDSIIITFAVEPLDSAQDCQTAPPTPYRVELSAPVGDRELLDGLYFPPRPVSRA